MLLTISLPLTTTLGPHSVNANPGNYPVSIYFHKQSSKTLNQIISVLWANASQAWSTATQTESRNVRNTQPGQWDYYSQPALTENLTLVSPAIVHFWLSASATLSGATLATTLFSVAPSGAKISIGTITTTQTIGTSPTEFTITINLTSSTIQPGYILNVETVLNISGTTFRTATISYDTAAFPDRLVLTLVDHIAIPSINYYNATGPSMSSFSRNWTSPQRVIEARANVSDALGLYQVSAVTFTASSPLSTTLVNNASMTMMSGSNSSGWGLWHFSFSYKSNDTSGTYKGSANVYDRNGNVRSSSQFLFQIFATWNTTVFIHSSNPNPYAIQNALITVAGPSGIVWSSFTSSGGFVSGLLDDTNSYNVSAYWEGGLVSSYDNVSIVTNTIANLTAAVHLVNLAPIFYDDAGRPLDSSPSSMSMIAPNGTRISPNPAGSYLLQDGTFQVDNVTWKGINVVPAGAQLNPANLNSLRLNVFDLSASVIDQNSRALSNAKITLVSDNVVVATSTSDTSGIAFFHQLPGGDYVITVESSGTKVTKNLTLNRTQGTEIQVSGAPSSPSTTFDLYIFAIIFGSVAAMLGGVFGFKRTGFLKFNEHDFNYLDTIVGGKLPSPASLLVGGDAGSGKTLFCEQIAASWLARGRSVVFFSYQNSPDQVRKSMASLGVDVKNYESSTKLALVDCYSSPAKIKSSEKYLMENPFDLTALGIKLSQTLKDVGEKEPLVVIDPISALFSKVPASVVVGFLDDKASRIRGLGGDTLYSLGKGTAPKEVLGQIEAGADGILDLSLREGKKGLERSLRVRKLRNQAFKESSFDFRIKALKGIRFLTKRF